MSPSNRNHDRRGLGERGEQLALEHYRRLGFELVERNFRTRWGELDLIVRDRRSLVFVEVKTARAGAGVGPLERLHGEKRRRVRMMARSWLHERRLKPRPAHLRFDAVAVTLDRHGQLLALEQLEGAF